VAVRLTLTTVPVPVPVIPDPVPNPEIVEFFIRSVEDGIDPGILIPFKDILTYFLIFYYISLIISMSFLACIL
jgi:hypothetical protein